MSVNSGPILSLFLKVWSPFIPSNSLHVLPMSVTSDAFMNHFFL